MRFFAWWQAVVTKRFKATDRGSNLSRFPAASSRDNCDFALLRRVIDVPPRPALIDLQSIWAQRKTVSTFEKHHLHIGMACIIQQVGVANKFNNVYIKLYDNLLTLIVILVCSEYFSNASFQPTFTAISK